MTSVAPVAPLDLTNIQGDILSGIPKKAQTYMFFTIANSTLFKKALPKVADSIKTVAQIVVDRSTIAEHKSKAHAGYEPPLLSMTGVNIAFSHPGLIELGITENLGDTAFISGQLNDTPNLGDNVRDEWDPAFKRIIHGLVLVGGDCHSSVDAKLFEVTRIFGSSIGEITRIRGDVRPGAENGHEHFGFLDGISNPAVDGFDTKPNPGQESVPQGIFLAGREGDPINAATPRPAWALDGSFLVFRYLFQLVPEFNEFLRKNPILAPGLSPEEGSEFLGARLVGRWKSGAPLDLAPTRDDPKLGADPLRNNNFRYQGEGGSQVNCPFAAHVRKTNPRADLEDNAAIGTTTIRRILRRGIPFGPEVTPEEKRNNKTQHGRGLLFVCYQSSIVNGFQFIQQRWANNPTFPPNTTKAVPGLDGIIGQPPVGTAIKVAGTNPESPSNVLTLTEQFVIPRGGEYFFVPSVSALKGALSV